MATDYGMLRDVSDYVGMQDYTQGQALRAASGCMAMAWAYWHTQSYRGFSLAMVYACDCIDWARQAGALRGDEWDWRLDDGMRQNGPTGVELQGLSNALREFAGEAAGDGDCAAGWGLEATPLEELFPEESLGEAIPVTIDDLLDMIEDG